jgi:hypothetical protein
VRGGVEHVIDQRFAKVMPRLERCEARLEVCQRVGTLLGQKALGDFEPAQEMRIIPAQPINAADRGCRLQMENKIAGIAQLCPRVRV